MQNTGECELKGVFNVICKHLPWVYISRYALLSCLSPPLGFQGKHSRHKILPSVKAQPQSCIAINLEEYHSESGRCFLSVRPGGPSNATLSLPRVP